jgi:hypothetical protein
LRHAYLRRRRRDNLGGYLLINDEETIMPATKSSRCSSASFTDACHLGVSIETTGFCGGDAGHGGRTSVVFRNEGAMAMEGMVSGQQGGSHAEHEAEEVVLTVAGDAELAVLIDGLRWAADELARLAGRR